MKQVESNGNKTGAVLTGLGLLLVILYTWSAPKGTTPEDASEFILTAYYKGLPHPPGYPLFVWLGHLFSYLPWGNPAQKIAFLSSLCIAGSAVIWGLFTKALLNNLLISAWVTLVYGLSLPLWSSGQLVEVYPLHTFLLSLTFFLAFKLTQSSSESSRRKLIFFVGLFLGLSLANHYPLVVLAFPAFVALLYPHKDEILSLKSSFPFLMALFLGLTPYLYLWVVDRYSEFIFSSPIHTLSQFLDYVLRKEYAANDRSKVFSFREVGLYGWVGIRMLFWAFTPIVFVAAFWGTKRLFIKSENKPLLLALVLGTLSSFLFLFFFWQPDYYRLAIELFETFHGFALGCFLLLAAQSIWNLGILRFLLVVPLILLILGFKPLDRRTDTFTKDYASLVLDSLPPNSLLLVKGDTDAGILAYYHFLENKRPDITLISQVSALLPKKPFDRSTDIPSHQHQIALLNLISAHLSVKHPVFSIGPIEYFSPQTSPFPLSTKNYGLFREIYENEPAPTRDFTSLKAQEVSFLDRVIGATFEPNFKHYRDRAVSDVCHALLISGTDHPAFEVLPRCQLLKAQWLHVEQKDYENADPLFLHAIKGSKLSQDSELAEMGKDFLLNRLKLLETRTLMEGNTRQVFLQETFQIALPLALQFRTCKNNLAPKLLQLATKTGFETEANLIRKTFSDCGF